MKSSELVTFERERESTFFTFHLLLPLCFKKEDIKRGYRFFFYF